MKINLNIFNLQEWQQNTRDCKYLFKQVLLWEKETLKTCQERPHLVSGCFKKVFL